MKAARIEPIFKTLWVSEPNSFGQVCTVLSTASILVRAFAQLDGLEILAGSSTLAANQPFSFRVPGADEWRIEAFADPGVMAAFSATLSAPCDRGQMFELADPATQATLAAVLAKQSADPATQTTLAAVLAKQSADPATQTTLAAILAQLVVQLARLDLPTKHAAITPNDATDVTAIASKGLQIGGSGNIYYTLVSAPDTEVGPVIVQPGQTLWGQFAKVKTKGGLTTATNIFGLS